MQNRFALFLKILARNAKKLEISTKILRSNQPSFGVTPIAGRRLRSLLQSDRVSTACEPAASLRLHNVNDSVSHQAQLDGRVTTPTGLTFASLRVAQHDEVGDSSIVTHFIVRRSTCSGLR